MQVVSSSLEGAPDDDFPHEATLLFEKFTVNYPLRAINEKEFINPAYYNTEGFDLRASAKDPNSAQVDYSSSLILSAFNNPQT